MIICDTDVMIDYWNIRNQRHSTAKDILENSVEIGNVLLSAVTKMELIVGASNRDELARINKNIHQFEVVLIDDKYHPISYPTASRLYFKPWACTPGCINCSYIYRDTG